MCFRPAQIQMNNCPECGKTNKPIAKVCVDCGAELNTRQTSINCPICGVSNPATATECVNCGATEHEIMEAMQKQPSAPVAPGAPKPPSAPGAPKSPSAPGVPKAPSAPGAPKPPSA